MPRDGNESVREWHVRATREYLQAATEAATRRSGSDDGLNSLDSGVTPGFADLYAASKAVLSLEDGPDRRT
ncbi:hypothetical protein ACVBEQ_23305 [Nakamurella sp. GG22]